MMAIRLDFKVHKIAQIKASCRLKLLEDACWRANQAQVDVLGGASACKS
jgi:hypothetical protein